MATLLYFHHAHASMRLRRNGIRQVEVNNGMMITNHEGKVTALTKQLLGSRDPLYGTNCHI
jgi:hypothetical protein